MPPIDDPAHDGLAVELGKVILWERAQLPPVVLGTCEVLIPQVRASAKRCFNAGLLIGATHDSMFLCPRHGATLERAVRRWPR